MNIYVTADEHYGHVNVIKLRKRFRTLAEMDDVLLSEVLLLDEGAEFSGTPITVYHLGDTVWSNPRKYFPKILGRGFARHIFLQGSHDRKWSSDAFGIFLYYRGIPIYMTHDPIHANCEYPVNLVGHVHHLWKYMVHNNSVLVNVGVDKWKYKPVKLEEAVGLARSVMPNLFTTENLARYSQFREKSTVNFETEEYDERYINAIGKPILVKGE